MKFEKFETKARSESSGSFLNIKDGESITAVLRGEIQPSFILWKDGKSEDVVEGTPKTKRRFTVNAIIQENGKLVAKKWDFGTQVYGLLGDINDVYPLNATKIRITRKGKGLDTVYVIMPILNHPDALTDRQLTAIEGIELLPLEKETQQSASKALGFEEDVWSGF